MSRRWMAAAGAVAVMAFAGCGGESTRGADRSTSGGANASKSNLTVSAAASLKSAFTSYAQQFPQANVRYSFAGSDVLAAQIEQGIKPDVFASANTKLPEMLYRKNLVGRPVVFAMNTLVIAVPSHSKIQTLADLERPGVTIAIGSASVPIGSYTRTVLAKTGREASTKILANVRSEEPDVSGIVGKLTEGAVDAGFTYVTDVKATKGALKAIPLPSSLQPVVAYAAAIVSGSPHAGQGRQFIAGLLRGAGRRQLLKAGFLPPPGT